MRLASSVRYAGNGERLSARSHASTAPTGHKSVFHCAGSCGKTMLKYDSQCSSMSAAAPSAAWNSWYPMGLYPSTFSAAAPAVCTS
jgi:hypothetical protein